MTMNSRPKRSGLRKLVPVSRKDNELGAQKVNQNDLLSYLIKLAILHHRVESRGKEANTLLTNFDSYSISPSDPVHRRSHSESSKKSSYASLFTFGIKSFESELPENIKQVLNASIKKILTSSNSSYAPDEISQRIYKRFDRSYNDPNTFKARPSCSIIGLLNFFADEAQAELSEYYSATQFEYPDPSRYIPMFIKLLIHCFQKGGCSTSHAILLDDLQNSKRLTSGRAGSNSSLKTSSYFSNEGKKNNSSPRLLIEYSLEPQTFFLSNMGMASHIATLFNCNQDQIQLIIDSLVKVASERAAIADLKYFRDDLETNNYHPIYSRDYFNSVQAFETWKANELKSLYDQMIYFSYTHVSIVSGHGFPLSPNKSITHIYMPSSPKNYYCSIVQICLKCEATNPFNSVVLSKNSCELLNKVGDAWRLSCLTRALIFLCEAVKFYFNKFFPFEKLPEVFQLTKYFASNGGMNSISFELWPSYEKSISYSAVKPIYGVIVDKIASLLTRILDAKEPQIKPLLKFLGTDVVKFATFNGYPELDPENEQISFMKENILKAATVKYNELISHVPQDKRFSYKDLENIAEQVCAEARFIQKRYSSPLFGKVNISRLVMKVIFKQFSIDCDSMSIHMIAIMHHHTEFDLKSLYNKLLEVRNIFNQVVGGPFSFNMEDRFEPFALISVQNSFNEVISWVDRSVAKDQFLPIQDSYFSPSVVDMFESLNQLITGAVDDLHWSNKIHVASFYTIAMKEVAFAICHYAEEVLKLFVEQISAGQTPGEVIHKSRHDKWISEVLGSINREVKIEPYNIHQTTCIKLNNIEKAQVELGKIEEKIDSEKQYSYLSEGNKKGSKPKSFIFTIKIIEAMDLKACDMNGLSDPYVTMILSTKKKQVVRTRTIYETLDPVWNETFDFTLTESSTLSLTVWDENINGNHSLCGRRMITLYPHEFNDFIPQEMWVLFDTQGRLRLSITMESERDDIRFSFGKSLRTLVRTEAEMIQLVVEKFQVYIKFWISKKTLRVPSENHFDKISKWFSVKIGNESNNNNDSMDIAHSINPLLVYLDQNFGLLARHLSPTLKVKVMTKTWETLLEHLEELMIPPLSSKPTSQLPLTDEEKNVLSNWTQVLLYFFHNEGRDVPMNNLMSKKFDDFWAGLTEYYDLPTSELIRLCDEIVAKKRNDLKRKNALSISDQFNRTLTVMSHRNLRTLRNEQSKLRNAEKQSPGNEDIILRILRLRGQYDYIAQKLTKRV